MKCRICNNSSLKKYCSSKEWFYFRCSNCGYVQIDEIPERKILNEIYSIKYFENTKYKDTKTLFKEYQFRTELMLKYFKPKDKILDFGCAMADFIRYSGDKFTFYGTDFSKDAIIKARALLPEMKNNLLQLEEIKTIPDHFLDGIVMWT